MKQWRQTSCTLMQESVRVKARKRKINHQGFSLIEIAVVLAVAAVIGLAIWKLLPALTSSTNEDTPQAQVLGAQQALEGFILRQNRLPCPASAATGIEDCTGTAAAGQFPYKTVGLSGATTIRYGVYRNPNAAVVTADADLAAAKLRYSPPVAPTPIIPAAPISGLDFCVGLKNAIATPAAGTVTSAGVAVAYALVHPGLDGVINVANSTTNFATGSSARDINYDDRVLTAGLSELFGRVNCPERLGMADGAARAAYAAYDIDRSAEFHERFRQFDVRVQTQLLAVAELNKLIAIADAAITVMATALGAAGAADTKGATLVLSVIALPLAVAQSAYGLAQAIIAVTEAQTALAESRANLVAATAFRVGTNLLYLNARTQASASRTKGLLI
jgi:prepilin-type N-terminal cleavage/methylation domain-containing protein